MVQSFPGITPPSRWSWPATGAAGQTIGCCFELAGFLADDPQKISRKSSNSVGSIPELVRLRLSLFLDQSESKEFFKN
jgi:hypothetical protein